MADTHPTNVEPSADPDLSGQELGDYQLLRRLGRGGMADVYLAQQKSLRRQVAFKVLKKHLAVDATYVRRFVNEAQSAASLVHGNIVQIHEVGCIDGVHFIAQEYVKGQNLRQLLDRHGALDPATSVNIMRQVAAALHKAGEQGIIHRDIKPENIMLSAKGDVKVADFGLARTADADVNLTQVGMTMGTPLYMSPEQAEGKTVDQRSDLYSFGVTCFHMLAGQPPFDGETVWSIAIKHLQQEPKRLENLRPDLPIGLCCAVHKMMSKAPEDRHQNAMELLRELRALPIEGLEDGWPGSMDIIDATERATVFDAESSATRANAATQRLDTVMQTEAMQRQRTRKPWPWIASVTLFAILFGCFIAWATRPDPLLSHSQNTKIPRKKNALEQYRFAIWSHTEEAYLSVERHFPLKNGLSSQERSNRQLNIRRSRQRLAELYVEQNQFERAMPIFTEFANMEETAAEFRAFGLAGQALVYWHRQDRRSMKQPLDEVRSLRQFLSQNMLNVVNRLEALSRQPNGS